MKALGLKLHIIDNNRELCSLYCLYRPNFHYQWYFISKKVLFWVFHGFQIIVVNILYSASMLFVETTILNYLKGSAIA